MKIFHNPQCSKSRETLQLLKEKGEEVEIIEYLKDTPTFDQLKEIIDMLGISSEDLIRKGEAVYKENFKGKKLSNDEWIRAMVTYPKLIERPIVIKDKKAVIGRPPTKVIELL